MVVVVVVVVAAVVVVVATVVVVGGVVVVANDADVAPGEWCLRPRRGAVVDTTPPGDPVATGPVVVGSEASVVTGDATDSPVTGTGAVRLTAMIPAAAMKVIAAVTSHEKSERTRSTSLPNLDRRRNAKRDFRQLTGI